MEHDLEAIFGSGGALAGSVEGYAPREAQLRMAQAVGAALDSGETLICEAGTGTGKTLAYLTPLVLGGARALVSTATRQLQEQLYRRDLPVVARALGRAVDSAILKGRANYLCRHRLEVEIATGWAHQPRTAAALELVRSWARSTEEGDLAEIEEIGEHAPVRRLVTSTAENCLGQECACYTDCFVVAARRRAARADLVVVNHHLYLSDLALKEQGFGELLPETDAVILDEAHQLPELAAAFLGERLGSNQLLDLADDVARAQAAEAPDTPGLAAIADGMRGATRALRTALAPAGERVRWEPVASESGVVAARDALAGALAELGAALEATAVRGPDLGACARRCRAARALLARLTADEEQDEETAEEAVRWAEIGARSFALHSTPLEAGREISARARASTGALVLTSATLAVAGSLDHFAARVGLEEAERLVLESPFDFARQTRCYLPRGLPLPADPGYRTRLADVLVPVLEASRGRAFVLCTSHAALADLGTLLGERVPFPLLVQGRAPREALLRMFRETANAVLIGTYSFWEGVDVRGPALSCVVIDKLPFAAPGDPVLDARCARARERGESAFADVLLPQAVMTLKQGVGRLIRDRGDRGVIVLCDPRLATRSYGAVFMRSLPPMTAVDDVVEIESFFADEHESAGGERLRP